MTTARERWIQLWPVIVSVVVVAGGIMVAEHRLGQAERGLTEVEKTIETFDRRVDQLELGLAQELGYIRERLAKIETNTELLLDDRRDPR